MPEYQKDAAYRELEAKAIQADLDAKEVVEPPVRLHKCCICGRVYDDVERRLCSAVCVCGFYPIVTSPEDT